MAKILITTSSFNTDTDAIRALENAGYEIVLNPHKRKLSEDEIGELLKNDTNIIGLIAGTEPLTRAVMQNAPHLKIISRCGTGMDSVDLEAAKDLSIPVLNTPDAPTDAVAELAIGMILDVLRGISLQDRSIRDGNWTRPMGGLLGVRTIGVIGYGRIGQRVANIARGFGAKIVFYDPVIEIDLIDPKRMDSIQELCKTADIISLHVPYTKDNHHMFDETLFNMMKPGSILVNASRGGLIDENALYQALESEKIAGAALDVYENEPYTGSLKDLDNVVLTAHTGSYAKEARQRQEDESAQNLFKALSEI